MLHFKKVFVFKMKTFNLQMHILYIFKSKKKETLFINTASLYKELLLFLVKV